MAEDQVDARMAVEYSAVDHAERVVRRLGTEAPRRPHESRVPVVDRVLDGSRGQARMQIERHLQFLQRRPQGLESLGVEVQPVLTEVAIAVHHDAAEPEFVNGAVEFVDGGADILQRGDTRSLRTGHRSRRPRRRASRLSFAPCPRLGLDRRSLRRLRSSGTRWRPRCPQRPSRRCARRAGRPFVPSRPRRTRGRIGSSVLGELTAEGISVVGMGQRRRHEVFFEGDLA